MNIIGEMIKNIVKYSHIKDEQEVRDRVLMEFVVSTINVLDQYNKNMDKFYTQTDVFLFELTA